ncbi:MAG: aspartate ammonia-lyase [Deltaproteobacteria bacterium]|nr:aspartate ammonia-lyase [Deltaproteobacteria bacterium]
MDTRTEHDSLGTLDVPTDAYWGIETLRAVRNFPISGLRTHPELVRATALVKQAAAEVNVALGELDAVRGGAIARAAAEVAAGGLADQFVVDVFQAGAGTSLHMNVNEVLANRALELLGRRRGDYAHVHPHDHVNLGQSTNDVVPTALRLAALRMLGRLERTLGGLIDAFADKGREFDHIVKAGRTHLQDAVPVRLGQELAAYAAGLDKDRERLRRAAEVLAELNLGGTAAGTGINAHPRFREAAVARLRELSDLPVRPAANPMALMQSMADFADASAALRTLALDLIRIANDLRLLASGPRTGLAELALPVVQPGSSIMPGKVNPVMAEMLDMVGFQVLGNDTTVAAAVQAGQLELNVMLPVLAHDLLQSLELLDAALRAFTERAVRGITADADRCRRNFERSAGLATLLTPSLGYDRSAALAQEAARSGRGVLELAAERGLLGPAERDRLLADPRALTEPGRFRATNRRNDR